jgi:hypothetical protein
MVTQKGTELLLQNKELKKENLRLVKKVAKLEVQVLTAKRHEAQMRKFTIAKPLISENSAKKVIKMFLESKKTPQKLPAA